MDKSFINIDLDDPRTGLVAEALSNKTCVKILDLLSTQEITASDIALKLDIPLNTTGYNLEKLINAGLVEKSSNFFWSVKGKKTPVYRVANRKIIISPKRIMKGIMPFILLMGVIAIVAVSLLFNNYKSTDNLSTDLKQFESYEDLVTYVEKSNLDNGYGLFAGRGEATSGDSGALVSQAGAKGESFASDYSNTNIQVANVDEADIVKNDGKYIYTVNQNKVIIVEAYPANSMKIVSELEFDNYVNGIFVEDGKLIVIESSYGYYSFGGAEAVGFVSENILPPTQSNPEVRIHVYDVSKELISDPNLLETFVIDGNYYTARLIDGHIYVISNKYVDSSNLEIPFFKAGNNVESVVASRVYYPGYYESNLIFTSVMAIDLDSLEYKGDVFLLGSSSVIYVSENSVYLTSSKTYDYLDVQEDALGVILEVLPGEFRSDAEKIIKSEGEYYIKSDKIALVVQNYFNSLKIDEKKEFEKSLAEANKDYYEKVSKQYEKTIIHKIGINGMDISYSGTAEVSGYVLNQFSMDEFDSNLRIATTTGNSFGNIDNSLNHLYVLSEDLEIIGSVENLASGERIYSARFVGEKAYMVTFRQVDPLYVIDLSDAKNPEVLGFLKVTGFSNYLHPIGDDLLLGIGREATEEGRAEGLKISLFDVSDFENPIELDKYVVESDWSYSEAEYEHKAVLFDDARDLLVIPVTYSQQLGNNWEYWQGAFAFTVTDEDVSLKGKISHESEDKKFEDNYGYGLGYVQRSLFMDDVLYTISNYKIKASDITSLMDISSVDLPFEEQIYTIY
ncbi:MAG: beta-propeller domain-containing protein [Nanoarchaeota archaeon]|mgnify:CR=1 FL=1